MSSPEAGPSGRYCRPKSPAESHHSASNSSLNTESSHSSISLRYASSCQSIPYDSFDEEIDLDAVENWLKDELKEEEEMEQWRRDLAGPSLHTPDVLKISHEEAPDYDMEEEAMMDEILAMAESEEAMAQQELEELERVQSIERAMAAGDHSNHSNIFILGDVDDDDDD